MQPQNWRNRDERSNSREGYERSDRYHPMNRESSRWDHDQERGQERGQEGRWADRNRDEDYGTQRAGYGGQSGGYSSEGGGYARDIDEGQRRRGGGAYEWQGHGDMGHAYREHDSYREPQSAREYSDSNSDRYASRNDRGNWERGNWERGAGNYDERHAQSGQYGMSGRHENFGRGQNYGQHQSQNYGQNYGQIKYSDRGFGSFGSEGQSNSVWNERGGPVGSEQRQFLGRGPKGYTRSDERIREEICEQLSQGHIDASDIEVTVQGGEVTLSGTVMDRRTKRMAEEMLDHISGVKDIDNKLKVKAQGEARASTHNGEKKENGASAKSESTKSESAKSESTKSESKSESTKRSPSA